jgi:protein TonB
MGMQDDSNKSKAPMVVGLLLVIVFAVAAVWFLRGIVGTKNSKPERMVQNITVIRPPPPPPPDQPPPPPPPEKIQEPIPQDEPPPTPDNAPAPSEQLGVDADASAGSDGFGLAARKGGADLVGGGGSVFAWFLGKLKDEVTDRLSGDPKLRGKRYTVVVRLWFEPDGRIKEVKITNGVGNREIENEISTELVGYRLNPPPPLEMPKPISVQIVSRT